MNIIAGKRGCDGQPKIRETFGMETTENDRKRPQNVFTASLLRPYRLLTDFASSPTPQTFH